ncbi:MAG: pilus assembly protein [Actinomycetia bacterium]|nr:pilus assembly protein [Actinomycetes bacterium]
MGKQPRPCERGAQLVEFALVVPIFLLLVLGIIDFSVAFNDYNSVRAGVSEGARQGVVANFADGGCVGTSSQQLACLTRNRIGLDAADTKVKVVIPETYAVGDSLRVCAMYDVDSITGMFDLILDERVATAQIDMRIEKLDDDAPLENYEETALTGENWTWCS